MADTGTSGDMLTHTCVADTGGRYCGVCGADLKPFVLRHPTILRGDFLKSLRGSGTEGNPHGG